MTIVVTGAAGFIGYHLAERLLREGRRVVGIDNMNDYYDVKLKEDRIANIADHPNFVFLRADISDADAFGRALDGAVGGTGKGEGAGADADAGAGAGNGADAGRGSDAGRGAGNGTGARMGQGEPVEAFVHLAAQAGVRYSLQNPRAYVDSNLVGFANVLEWCRHRKTPHLIYASSSSVYGMNASMPFSVHDNVDHPVSLYAATKKANELMAHAYSHLYGLPTTGLRFFTVYGPWGRPDMAYFSFTRKIRDGEPIEVFNGGRMQRDFTYIDDIVEGIVRLLPLAPAPDPGWDRGRADPGTSSAPYRVYNIGNRNPVELMDMIRAIEREVGRDAAIEYKPMQPGDVTATYADVADLQAATGFAPATPLEEGLRRFVAWHRSYCAEREAAAEPVPK